MGSSLTKLELNFIGNSKKQASLVILSIIGFSMISSYVSFLFAFESPLHQYPLTVSTDTYNPQGLQTSLFDVNDIIVISSEIRNLNSPSNTGYFYDNVDPFDPGYGYDSGNGGTPVQFRLIVTIIDPEGYPVYISKSRYDINAGVTKDYDVIYGHSEEVPVLGDYIVRVMVWDDWLPEGIALSSEIGEVTFTLWERAPD